MRWTKDTSYWVRFKMTNYKQVKIYQHREVWEATYGVIPKGMVIDHINGDGFDNRLANLRLTTMSGNNHNRVRANKNSKSGHIGVYWHSQRKKWHASIMVKGKKMSLGLHEDINKAIKAYEEQSACAKLG